jgi:hypothetical protein
MLEEEFPQQEFKAAIQEAKEVSAPGLSGQTIAFFKLLLLAMPIFMTDALNQLVFLPHLLADENVRWIRQRTVVYIPKVPLPTTPPSDYRPLSMLEVLYKIPPSRICSALLSQFLPAIIGECQHGFVAHLAFKIPLSLLPTIFRIPSTTTSCFNWSALTWRKLLRELGIILLFKISRPLVYQRS